MHLLYVTNDAYVPHVATTLASVFENNKEMHFCVHVLATDISSAKYSRLKDFVNRYGHELDVKVVNTAELEIDLSVCGKWGIFPSLKLYAADLYPDIDLMLYMDADMICIGSLKQIEQVDMDNWYVAESTDEEGAMKHKERLSMPADAFYGCAGLVYFNLAAWRRDNVRQKCFAYFNDPKNKNIIKWGEQDVINKVCMEHIYELPIEFNMFSHYYLHHGRAIPGKYKANFAEHKKHAVIIHYIDTCKPWFKDNRFPLKKYYWKYHALTPWKEQRYGYSKMYEGWWNTLKNSIKCYLHYLNIRKYEYVYDV